MSATIAITPAPVDVTAVAHVPPFAIQLARHATVIAQAALMNVPLVTVVPRHHLATQTLT